MIDLDVYGDGSGREPRKTQIAAIDWLRDTSNRHTRVILGPVGAGKSFIAKNQCRSGTVIIAPDNNLLKDYQKQYPELNLLMGKDHYKSREEYLEAKDRLWRGEPTLTNPYAWYYYQKFYQHQDFVTTRGNDCIKIG